MWSVEVEYAVRCEDHTIVTHTHTPVINLPTIIYKADQRHKRSVKALKGSNTESTIHYYKGVVHYTNKLHVESLYHRFRWILCSVL